MCPSVRYNGSAESKMLHGLSRIDLLYDYPSVNHLFSSWSVKAHSHAKASLAALRLLADISRRFTGQEQNLATARDQVFKGH
jgi:hypothetical protein